MKKLSNIEAGLKKSVAYIKKRVFVNRKCLKASFSVKTKIRSFCIYISALAVSCLLQNNLIHKVRADLINERQLGSLGKVSEPNLARGQLGLPENYNYLNPTELFDLCCSVVQYIPLDCGLLLR